MIETRGIDLPCSDAAAPRVTLQCRLCGPADGPLLVFLHGFPEAAFVWDALLERFGAAGFRCVAPNLRGYPGSYSPADVAAYRANLLAADVAGLIEAMAPAAPEPYGAAPAGPPARRAHAVVAHDWGGAVAWGLAIAQPQRLERLVMLNSPHPGTFLRALRTSPAQQAASDYMNFLRRPDAEARLSADDFAVLWGFFTRFGGATWLTESLRAEYRRAWSAGLSGPLNYYRASPLHPPHRRDDGSIEPGSEADLQKVNLPDEMLQVRVPTTVIWGEGDTALLPELLDGLDRYVADLSIVRMPECSHWLVHEAPQAVGDAIARAVGPAPRRI